MAFQIAGLDHLVLRVRDLEASIAFYCEVLGCQEERRLDDLGLVQLRAGRSLIDLVDVAVLPTPQPRAHRSILRTKAERILMSGTASMNNPG